MKLKIHSVVDLITNSSTVIFTYSEGSLPALKELVNEMLKVFNKEETFDDIFYAKVFLEEQYEYMDYILRNNIETDITDSDGVEKLIHEVLIGNVEKPQWMIDAESSEDDYSYYRNDTMLEILPKEEKYEVLADLLLRYLYSIDHEAIYNS